MLRTCMSTVRGLRNSSWATSRLVRPTAISRTTSSSRRLSPEPSASAAARLPSRALTDSPSAATSAAASEASGRAPSLRAVRYASPSRSRAGSRSPPRLAGGGDAVPEPIQGRLALAAGRERHAGTQLDLGLLEGDVEAAVDL